MLTRVLIGTLLAAFMLSLFALGGIWLGAAIYLFMIIAVLELYWAFNKADIKMPPLAGVFFVAFLPLAIHLFGIKGILGLYMLSGILTLTIKVIKSDLSVTNTAFTLFMFFYPCMMMSMLLLMLMTFPYQMGRMAVFVTLTCAAATDVFAYFIGSLFGKHKLCPSISPNKSVEGAAGGLLGSILMSVISAFVIAPMLDVKMEAWHFIIIGAAVGVMAQIGDLAASIIKRSTGIKDFGSIFPGHGGVMDRLDSILFAAPTVYIYFSLIILRT